MLRIGNTQLKHLDTSDLIDIFVATISEKQIFISIKDKDIDDLKEQLEQATKTIINLSKKVETLEEENKKLKELVKVREDVKSIIKTLNKEAVESK